jgi:hypothetical protein
LFLTRSVLEAAMGLTNHVYDTAVASYGPNQLCGLMF